MLETDEYGVETWHNYDNFGNAIKKIIRHDEADGEELVFSLTASDTNVAQKTSKSYTDTQFNDPLGHMVSLQYCGVKDNGELESDNTLVTTYGYDALGNKLVSVANNIGDKNHLSYDGLGRLFEVTPTGFSNKSTDYGYRFEYSQDFGDPVNYWLVSGENKAKQLLTSKNIDYSAGTMTTKQYRFRQVL